jgi:hypothetical protein
MYVLSLYGYTEKLMFVGMFNNSHVDRCYYKLREQELLQDSKKNFQKGDYRLSPDEGSSGGEVKSNIRCNSSSDTCSPVG